MKSLVTGGGGFLGLHITEQLVKRGDAVRSFSRGRYDRLDELGVEQVQGDLRNLDAVTRACEGIDSVFHVAALPGIWGSWKLYHGINTLGTENVIAACKQQQVPKLVYTSSPSVIYDNTPHTNVDETRPYPDIKSYLCHYPRSKALAEKAALKANGRDGLSTVAMRPHLLWGPRDNHLVPTLIRRAKQGRLWKVGDEANEISISYVENAAAAHLQAEAALAPGSSVAGEAFFIAEPKPVNMWSWIDELIARAGVAPVRKKISARKAWYVGSAMEAAYRLLPFLGEPPMTRFLSLQLSYSHSYNISKAKEMFGYEPKVTFEEGMNRLEPELRRWAQVQVTGF